MQSDILSSVDNSPCAKSCVLVSVISVVGERAEVPHAAV